MNRYEKMEHWQKIREVCGREPLKWFLVNHVDLTKEQWLSYEVLRSHYDQNSLEIIFKLLDEIAKWMWIELFSRGLGVSNSELDKRQDRIGLFYYEWDLEDLLK